MTNFRSRLITYASAAGIVAIVFYTVTFQSVLAYNFDQMAKTIRLPLFTYAAITTVKYAPAMLLGTFPAIYLLIGRNPTQEEIWLSRTTSLVCLAISVLWSALLWVGLNSLRNTMSAIV